MLVTPVDTQHLQYVASAFDFIQTCFMTCSCSRAVMNQQHLAGSALLWTRTLPVQDGIVHICKQDFSHHRQLLPITNRNC